MLRPPTIRFSVHPRAMSLPVYAYDSRQTLRFLVFHQSFTFRMIPLTPIVPAPRRIFYTTQIHSCNRCFYVYQEVELLALCIQWVMYLCLIISWILNTYVKFNSLIKLNLKYFVIFINYSTFSRKIDSFEP